MEIGLASARGVAVVDEGEFDRMIEIYTVYTGREQLRLATRRALDANRSSTAVRPVLARKGTAAPERRMATTHDE